MVELSRCLAMGQDRAWGVRWCILAADEKTSDPHYPSVDRFRQFVELRDLRPRTRESYLSYVVAIARNSALIQPH